MSVSVLINPVFAAAKNPPSVEIEFNPLGDVVDVIAEVIAADKSKPNLRLSPGWAKSDEYVGGGNDCRHNESIFLGQRSGREHELFFENKAKSDDFFFDVRILFNESYTGLIGGTWHVIVGEDELSGNWRAGKKDKHFPLVTLDGYIDWTAELSKHFNLLYHDQVLLFRTIAERHPGMSGKKIMTIIQFLLLDIIPTSINYYGNGWINIDGKTYTPKTPQASERIARAFQGQDSSRTDPGADR